MSCCLTMVALAAAFCLRVVIIDLGDLGVIGVAVRDNSSSTRGVAAKIGGRSCAGEAAIDVSGVNMPGVPEGPASQRLGNVVECWREGGREGREDSSENPSFSSILTTGSGIIISSGITSASTSFSSPALSASLSESSAPSLCAI